MIDRKLVAALCLRYVRRPRDKNYPLLRYPSLFLQQCVRINRAMMCLKAGILDYLIHEY